MRLQFQSRDVRPARYPRQASRLDIFLGIVRDEMEVGAIYCYSDRLQVLSEFPGKHRIKNGIHFLYQPVDFEEALV